MAETHLELASIPAPEVAEEASEGLSRATSGT